MGGWRALSAAVGIDAVVIPLFAYVHVTTALVVHGVFFMTDFLIFSPVTSIDVRVVGFAPKAVTVVVNAVPRALGYVFGGSVARVLLSRIADPTKDGVVVLGPHLHG